MIREVTAAEPRDGHRLWLRFDDGAEGVVDIATLVPFSGVFAPLRDPARFAELRVDADLGTVCWPNGADLDPLVLHASVTGSALPGQAHGRQGSAA